MLKRIILLCIVFILLLTSNTLGAQAPAGSLASAPAGSTVNFGGKTWIVLNSSEHLLLLQTPVGPMQFDPQGQGWIPTQMPDNYYNVGDTGNIAYYLNNTFLNALSNNDRILTKTWSTTQEGSAYTLTTNAKLGLPNQTMMSTYRSYITGFTTGYYWLLDTQIDPYGWPNKRYVTNDSPYTIGQETFLNHYARPVVYLQSGAMVNGSGDIYYNNASNISLSTNSNYLAGSSGSVTLSGKVYDIDNNNVTVSAVIGGVIKTIALTPAPTTNPASNNWSLTWSGNELPQGTYSNITITADDGTVNGTTQYTGTLTVDKTAPTVNISGPANLSIINNPTPQLNYSFSDGTITVKVDGITVPKLSGDLLSTLSNGVHTVTVTATDTAGNSTTASSTFTVDTVAPVVNLLSPSNGSTINNNTPLLTFTYNEGTAVVKVDGVTVPKVSGNNLNTLTDGNHIVSVTVTDAVGNLTTVTNTFTVDTVLPIVSLTVPSNSLITNNNTPLLTFTYNEGTAVVKVDGITVSKVSGNNLNTLTDGNHTVSVTVTDAAGNLTTVTNTFTVDATAPVASLIAPGNSSITNNNTPLLNFTYNEGTAVVKVDGVTVPKVSGNNLDLLSEGNHTVTVTATDTAGNITTVTNTFTIDTIAPVVNLTVPVDGSFINDNTPLITFTSNEGTAVVKVDGQTVTKVSGDSLDALSDGVHTILLIITDQAGNITTKNITFTVDTAVPVVNITAPTNGSSISNKTPQLTFTFNEGAAVVKVDGQNVTKISGDNLDALTDGSHIVSVEITDTAGNISTASTTFTVDAIAPTINIINPQDGTFTNSPLLIYTVSDGLVTVKLDGVPTPLTSGDSLGNLSDGLHSIAIESRDTAGNITIKSTNFTLDNTAPVIKLLPPPGNSTSDNTPLLNYIVSDGTTVVKVDGITVNKVSGDSLDELTEGPHTVTVEGTDQAGNKATESITFTIDSTPPIIGITSPANGAIIVDDTPQLNYSASEGTAMVRIDGVIVNKLPGQSLNNLVDGPHTIIIEATDAAGNRGSATSTFTVDRGAPMLFITSPSNGAVINEKTPIVNFNVTDGKITVKVDNQIVNKNSGDFLDALSEGIHTLRVESKDGAGNIGSSQVSFRIDSVAPTVNSISPAHGSTIQENTPLFSFFHSDGTAIVKVDGIVVSKVSGQKLDTLSNGSHTITVEATDLAGNKGTGESTFTVNSPTPGQTIYGPTVKIISPVNEAVTSSRNPLISYLVSEGTLTVKVDGQIINKITGQTLDTLSEGYHTLRVESMDSKGMIGAAQVIFKVDLTGPTINITSPITGSTIYEAKPRLTYTVSDGSPVVRVDGNLVSKTSGQNLDTLSLGEHTITVEATDQSGNTSVEQTTFTISSQISEVPETSIPDSSTQAPSYITQPPDNFMYQNDPFSQNTSVAGIEALPMTEQEKDLYLSGTDDGQDGPLKVTVSPGRGTYENAQVVNLAVNKPAIIYYTTNGSNPTNESNMFSAPILVDQNITIKYFAKDGDGKNTAIQSQKYTIKNSSKLSLTSTLDSPIKTPNTQNLKLKKNGEEGEFDSSLIITALGWVMLTTAVGSFLTLKG